MELYHGLSLTKLKNVLRHSRGGKIILYGRLWPDEDEDLQDQPLQYEHGKGWIYTVDNRNLELVEDEFKADGIILELRNKVSNPEIVEQGRRGREKVVKVEEWEVTGGIKQFEDEDGDIVGQQEMNVRDIFREFG